MAHMHPVYDTDTHFIIDPITRSVTNAESKKTTLIQRDHNSERFSFEVDKEIEGHDMSLCNEIEIHYNNIDSSKSNSSLGIYSVDDLVETEDGNKVVFTWLISENATLYSGLLTFIITFKCVEDGVVTYRWNTAINDSISIAKGMQNDKEISEIYPDIMSQWKMELFASVYGYKTVHIGPDEPDVYPYIWFDTSKSNDPSIGVITVKDTTGRVKTVSTMVSMSAIDGLEKALNSLQTAINSHTHTPEEIGAASIDHTHTAEDVGASPIDHSLDATIHVTEEEKAEWNGKQEPIVIGTTPPEEVTGLEVGTIYIYLGESTFTASELQTLNDRVSELENDLAATNILLGVTE